jgi:uncharacterized membrane protein
LLCFIIYLSIYLASDRVKGDRREDRAFVLLFSAVLIICDLVKHKIKDKKNEKKRKNDARTIQHGNIIIMIIIIIIIIIVLITHKRSDWGDKKKEKCQ